MYGFARYGLPTDDLLARLSPTITLLTGTEDPDYPITNWAARRPSKPAKFLEGRVRILFDFGGAANIAAFSLVYHNAEEGLPASIEWGSTSGTSTGTESLTIPAWTEDGWSVSPWVGITGSPTYRYWLLDLGGGSPGNSLPLSIGRPVFLGALRDVGNDVRFGVVRSEEHVIVEMDTTAKVETIYPLYAKLGALNGEIALRDISPDEDAQNFRALVRAANGRTSPWLLIPDVDVNEAWFVRFVDSGFEQTEEMINHNIFPFRVRELSRGLPFPGPNY